MTEPEKDLDEEAQRDRRALVEEHIADIMFDGSDSPEPGCLLCRYGLELGVWAYWCDEDDLAEIRAIVMKEPE
jgi:hypothetical protein